jgi:hypothetical protein
VRLFRCRFAQQTPRPDRPLPRRRFASGAATGGGPGLTLGTEYHPLNTNRSVFRDPIWQSVGVFVAILSLLGTMPFFHSEKKEVVAVLTGGMTTEDLFPSDAFALVDRQTKKERPNVDIEYLYIESVGNKAVRPGDIVEPITLSTPTARARIIAITDCSSGLMTPSGKTLVDMQWRKDDEQWKADPTLLNPNDTACVSIFSENASEATNYPEENHIEVTARIADATFTYFDSSYDYARYRQWSTPAEWLQVYIVFIGWQAYIFLLIQVALFLSTYVVAQAAGFLGDDLSSKLTRIALIVVLSTATAEVLTSFFNFTFAAIHPVSWMILIVHVLFMVALLIRLSTIRKENISEGRPCGNKAAIDDQA